MFVGYEIKTQQNQAKPMILETDIKLSQAVLDPSKGAKKEPVCLMVEYNKKQFILAVLDPTRSWQCPLDLMFSSGSEVKFFIKGSGSVHLTGFEYREEMSSDFEFDTSSDEEVEEEEDEPKVERKVERPSKVVAKNVPAKTNGVQKGSAKKEPVKPVILNNKESDDDDDDSDDEDFDSDMVDHDDDVDMSDEDMDDDDLSDEDLEDEDEDSEADED